MRANTPPPVPRLKLLRVRDPGAPRAPGAAALKQLFQNVWRMVPPSRRPKLADRQAMAVDVLVVSDDRMAALNAAHLKHKGPTDVLAFSMGEEDPERKAFFLGEIVVSFQTAAREAAARSLPVEEELSRYCVHGFLHLLGYLDDTPARRRAMTAMQEKVLSHHREGNC